MSVPVAAICVVVALLACSEMPGMIAPAGGSPADEAPRAIRTEISAVPADVDFAPVPLERLVGTADLIAIGTVSEATPDVLTIRVDESLRGGHDGQSIPIRLPERPEMFPPRQVPYQVGQRFVFFLVPATTNAENDEWSILGYPIAGEMPIESGTVYFDSYDVDGFEFEPSEVHGVVRPMQRFDLDEFKDAVTTYRNCFSWTQTTTRAVPVRICDAATLQDYSERGRFHRYLARMTSRLVPDDGGER